MQVFWFWGNFCLKTWFRWRRRRVFISSLFLKTVTVGSSTSYWCKSQNKKLNLKQLQLCEDDSYLSMAHCSVCCLLYFCKFISVLLICVPECERDVSLQTKINTFFQMGTKCWNLVKISLMYNFQIVIS